MLRAVRKPVCRAKQDFRVRVRMEPVCLNVGLGAYASRSEQLERGQKMEWRNYPFEFAPSGQHVRLKAAPIGQSARHSRESGSPFSVTGVKGKWIPAFAGMATVQRFPERGRVRPFGVSAWCLAYEEACRL
jgi:hypothetical protein